MIANIYKNFAKIANIFSMKKQKPDGEVKIDPKKYGLPDGYKVVRVGGHVYMYGPRQRWCRYCRKFETYHMGCKNGY
jgi:hypothetical protein